MEMDPVELVHNGECTTEGTSGDQLLPQGSPDTNEIFGDPQVLPRVGDQYQVEIPPLMSESEYLHLMINPSESTVNQSFLIGLPIPITWVRGQVDNIKREPQEFLCKPHARLESGEQAVAVHMALPSHRQEVPSHDHMYPCKGYSPLPCSIGYPWNNIEVESFLLGLYIFGKNLVLVKDFVETKEMGDILSYYYGKFYRSDAYVRWSECRKIRSKKCVYGQRIFTGWRQHELFSRLLSHASKECLNALLEVSKSFSEGKISLEDYVSTLKAKVGKSALIEAIGIGKGKQDLTGIVDPIKTTRPEIPTGNECNSLSSADIIKFLTGDYRLSKNRSHDLFWEAVWPRLLARGWHSEQPKNHCYVGSKHSLVFLIPGVKKFSKRRLVKGKHFFDSVADVLNQVTSDPTLLEIEEDTPKTVGKKEENGWETEMKLDEDQTFTVVDTSLVHEEGPSKVRELRTLPVDAFISPLTSLSKETDTDSSEEPEYEIELTSKLSNGHANSSISKRITEREVCTDQSDCLPSDLKQGRSTIGLDSTNVPIQDQENFYVNLSHVNHRSKSVKRQFSPRIKPCRSNYLTPITKRRRLTVCGIAETSHRENTLFGESQLKEEVPCCHLDSPGAIENMVGLEREKFSTASSAKGSSADYSEVILSEHGLTALTHEKVERRPLIDLNLPHLLQDSETDEPVTTEVADSQDDPITNNSFFPVETNKLEASQTSETFTDVINVVEQPVGRRQSTRNRPLTTKALEALACGYLSTKRKPRGEKGISQEHSISRPSRRPRRRDGTKGKHIDVVSRGVDYNDDEGVEECSVNTNIISNHENWFERKVIHDFLGVTSPPCHPDFSASKDD